MTKVLRGAVLAVTALALLATSKVEPPGPCPAGPLVPGPAQLEVDTTCGPAGTVTVTGDVERCAIALEGAAAVGLPSAGHARAGLHLDDADGTRHCDGEERAPGEWTLRCYDRHEGGCGSSDLPSCDGVVRVAAP